MKPEVIEKLKTMAVRGGTPNERDIATRKLKEQGITYDPGKRLWSDQIGKTNYRSSNNYTYSNYKDFDINEALEELRRYAREQAEKQVQQERVERAKTRLKTPIWHHVPSAEKTIDYLFLSMLASKYCKNYNIRINNNTIEIFCTISEFLTIMVNFNKNRDIFRQNVYKEGSKYI